MPAGGARPLALPLRADARGRRGRHGERRVPRHHRRPRRRFLQKNGDLWPAVSDPGGAIAEHYGVTAPPTTFVIDPAGRVTAVLVGPATQKNLDSFSEGGPGAPGRRVRWLSVAPVVSALGPGRPARWSSSSWRWSSAAARSSSAPPTAGQRAAAHRGRRALSRRAPTSRWPSRTRPRPSRCATRSRAWWRRDGPTPTSTRPSCPSTARPSCSCRPTPAASRSSGSSPSSLGAGALGGVGVLFWRRSRDFGALKAEEAERHERSTSRRATGRARPRRTGRRALVPDRRAGVPAALARADADREHEAGDLSDEDHAVLVARDSGRLAEVEAELAALDRATATAPTPRRGTGTPARAAGRRHAGRARTRAPMALWRRLGDRRRACLLIVVGAVILVVHFVAGPPARARPRRAASRCRRRSRSSSSWTQASTLNQQGSTKAALEPLRQGALRGPVRTRTRWPTPASCSGTSARPRTWRR